MDFAEVDFSMQLEDEEMWEGAGPGSAFDEPPAENDMNTCPETDLDPPTDVEQPADAAVHHRPMDGVPLEGLEESEVAAESVTAAAQGSMPDTPARGVVLPEVRTLAAPEQRLLTLRRRLVGKQRVPAASMSRPTAGSREIGKKTWAAHPYHKWREMTGRKQYLAIYNRFMWWLNTLPFLKAPVSSMGEPVHVKLLRRARFCFRQLNSHEKHLAYREFVRETQAPEHIVRCVRENYPETPSAQNLGYFLYARSVLLTWNGDWGIFVLPDVQKGDSWRVVKAGLDVVPAFEALWSEFQKFADGLAELLGAAHVAFSLELCTETWMLSAEVRVHAHMFLSGDATKLKLCRAEQAAFKGVNPHKSHRVAALNNRACSGFAGCYYLLAPKIGSLRTGGNVSAYKDFGVSPEWITNLVQGEKMEFCDARAEMTRCGKGYQRRMAELKAWEHGKKELKLQEHIVAEQAYHRAHNLAFRAFPEISAWFARNTKPHMRRKEILVVEGPSGLGKTEYIKALVGEGQCLELNAESMDTPMLLGLDSSLHKLVFWDECKVQLVLDFRKLFQCPPTLIALGISPTGRDVYNVWLNDAVMAIGSNSWSEQVAALSRASDREWLVKNTVLVQVSAKMYVG